ncbi:hypothetical protein [Jiangella anatolica]|uniref:Gram-positive cocci surface proteins LPxTG domain-containing protein n=1 Tax=Jiangella anatolica TaxID=2670374 RepID=A0A2W2B9S0_9ACTN|nr:hypothetical protein [Jiangella anatolica]PZF84321.1 hypothetical protein C1I92_08815 [Jiangella anatolica]
MSRRIMTAAAGAVTLVLVAAPTAAADVDITNTETVQVYLNSDGGVDRARVYDQLDLTGTGSVELRNPVTTDGLRNLDGFGDTDTEDGEAILETDVDGEQRRRTVSDFEGDLPLSVSIEYRLNGEVVDAGDVVGESGELEVRYRVVNETGESREIEYDDGTGNLVTAEEEVYVPMVGTMTTTLPSSFTDVRSDEANMGGDGRGGTRLTYALTLFPPIGSAEQEFGYTAVIEDGVIPRATLSALPVSPLDSPTYASGVAGYQGGIESGTALTEGAMTIDENLLRLRDGAADLLGGLIQLRNGAQELSTGLSDEAAPGARELADGLGDQLAPGARQLNAGAQEFYQGVNGELAPGARQLAAGAGVLADGLAERLVPGAGQLADGGEELAAGLQGQLAPGASQLADGASDAADGAGRLAEGLETAGERAPELIGGLQQVGSGLDRVDAGLTRLYDGIGGLPAQAQPLADGIDRLRAGIGDVDEEGTLLGGLETIRLGLEEQAVPALEQMAEGVYNESDNRDEMGAYQRLGCAITVLTDLQNQANSGFDPVCYGAAEAAALTAARVGVPASLDVVTRTVVLESLITQLEDGQAGLANPEDPGDRETLYGGLNSLTHAITSGDGILSGLVRLQCGLSNERGICDQDRPGLLQGLDLLDGGIEQLVSGVVQSVQGGVGEPDDTPADETLRGGVNGLSDGVDQIIAGGDALLAGLLQLTDGAHQLHAGNLQISDGAGELAAGAAAAADGAGRLADGAGQLEDGARDAADGAGQIEDGAGQLADGAGAAADGAGQIADGAGQLADGADEAAVGAGVLATGLEAAADGSVQIYDGLLQAAQGAPQLVDGAQRLSTEGASQLADAGQETAADFGTRYAMLEAGAERVKNEPLVNGAPDGATLKTAFMFEIPEVSGEGGRNLTRGVVALGVFAAAAAAATLLRSRRT